MLRIFEKSIGPGKITTYQCISWNRSWQPWSIPDLQPLSQTYSSVKQNKEPWIVKTEETLAKNPEEFWSLFLRQKLREEHQGK